MVVVEWNKVHKDTKKRMQRRADYFPSPSYPSLLYWLLSHCFHYWIDVKSSSEDQKDRSSGRSGGMTFSNGLADRRAQGGEDEAGSIISI